ncbi:MAG: lipopolysaccharide biosynthesis protein [Ketobacteraceae bacterium]|nr:lipopolysaccharide biosynthesis protein [Ketobacteraceae bacterium]
MSDSNSFPIQFVKALIKEIIAHRVLVTLIFSSILIAVVLAGLFYPLKYTSSTTIHADQQNIIAPLLEGQAEVTRVQDRSRVVREVIYSPRILTQVVEEVGLLPEGTSPKEVELFLNGLRGRLQVEGAGPGFIKISYQAQDPAEAFKVVSKVSELFIKDVSESKRNESREAFLFIDKQVKSYKEQLQQAESRLQAFKSGNIDGTEADVSRRITSLRAQIEEMELNLEDQSTKVVSLEKQLAQESRFIARQYRADVYRERLAEAQSRLATLRLSYKETYPDVVALKHQIEDLKKAIQEANETDFGSSSNDAVDSNINPLYEELRLALSEARVATDTIKRRLRLTRGLLEEEYERLKRIAEQEAQLAELTRDYTVTREIYEEMLDRKEKARLSMTLDIEGQGVNYKIQEPATFPLNPSGFRFLHFVLLAPFLGVMVPIGLLGAYVYLDPRIRFVSKIEENVDVPILGVVPHVHTKLSRRIMRGDIILLALFLTLVFGAYVGVVVLRVKGVL